MSWNILGPTGPRELRTGDPTELQMPLQKLSRLLGSYSYRYGSEIQLHESLGQVLAAAGYEFERERILDKKNRADFWLGGIVIEVKVDGSLAEALRQVDRYIGLDQVTGVILASTERWAEQALKARPAWKGKPFNMTRLRRQAL